MQVEANPGCVKSQEVSVAWAFRQSAQSRFLHNIRMFSSPQTVHCQHVDLIFSSTSLKIDNCNCQAQGHLSTQVEVSQVKVTVKVKVKISKVF